MWGLHCNMYIWKQSINVADAPLYFMAACKKSIRCARVMNRKFRCSSPTFAEYSFPSAATKQARPAADDARPAPVGNVFTDEMWTLYWGQSSFLIITAPLTESTRSCASFLISFRQVTPRPLISISVSFNQRRSFTKSLLAATVVIVCKSAWYKVIRNLH